MEDLKKIEKLSIIIPVYNEEKTIRKVYDKIMAVKFPIDKEIIIVDDCSTDNTREELKKIKKDNKADLKIIHHEKNLGRGGAIRTAINHVSGDYVYLTIPATEQGNYFFIHSEDYELIYDNKVQIYLKNKKSYLAIMISSEVMKKLNLQALYNEYRKIL